MCVSEASVGSSFLHGAFLYGAVANFQPGFEVLNLLVVRLAVEIDRNTVLTEKRSTILVSSVRFFKKELLVELSTTFVAQDVLYLLLSSLDLGIKIRSTIVNNEEAGMSLVRLLKLVVFLNGFLFGLVASVVSQAVIELVSAVGCSHHVDDGIVANISELDDIHTKVVHQRLPVFL